MQQFGQYRLDEITPKVALENEKLIIPTQVLSIFK